MPRPLRLPGHRALARLGWAATLGSLAMYLAYIDQIVRNLHGDKGSVIQPACAAVCCSVWLLYGALRPRPDWPLVIANVPGIALGTATVVTGL